MDEVSKKPETIFRERVVKFLDSLPNTWWVSIQQLARVGDPDILACINGKFVALELKSEKGKASELQNHKLRVISKAGGLSLLVYPEYLPHMKHELNRLSKAKF